MRVSRRVVSTLLGISTLQRGASAFVPTFISSNTRYAISRGMAAPGVELAPQAEVEAAIADTKATVLDVRSLDEILSAGFLKTDRPWIHAQCTLDACPLLDVAAEEMFKDKSAPIVIYCGSGKRATKAKEVLESKGYQKVLNAGGYPDDVKFLL